MGLLENLQQETVGQLALREPVVTPIDVTVREAVEKLRATNLGCIFVVDDTRKPIGQFTEAMLVQLLGQDPAAIDDPLADHMATQWPCVSVNDPVATVLESLQSKDVRFLCVVNEEKRLVGLTGQKGLMEFVADHFPGQVIVQRLGKKKPFPQQREGA